MPINQDKAKKNKRASQGQVDRVVRHFVTAKLVNSDECRQGVLVDKRQESIVVQGLHGMYVCENEYTVVPLSNLWGITREFAIFMGVDS